MVFKIAPMKAASEKAASKKAASKKAAPQKAAPEKAEAKKAAPDKHAPKKAAPGKAAAPEKSVKGAPPKAAAEKGASPKPAAEKAAPGKAAAPEKSAPAKPAAAKPAPAAAEKSAPAAEKHAASEKTAQVDGEKPAAPPQASARSAEDAQVETHLLEAHESFPNNPRLPVLVYRAAFRLPLYGDAAGTIERTFKRNGWSSGWRDGVYNYHHYHSNAHEALGCYAGKSRVQIGGPQGPVIDFARGDVVVFPAGAAHKSIETSKDFSVVGCYAHGRSYDMRRGRPEELADAEQQIPQVPLPERDPVYGEGGPLFQHWQA